MDDKIKKPLDEVFQEIFNSLLAGIHTVCVGQIQSFDEGTQLATVQIVTKRKYVGNDEATPMAVLEDVLVCLCGDGDFFLSFKPKKGSYCVVLVNERSLDTWYESGGIVDPGSPRRFDLSDSIAVCGLLPKNLALPAMHEGIAIRNRDLTTFVQVLGDAVNIESSDSVSVKSKGEIKVLNDNGVFTLAADGSFDVNGNLRVLK